jgi:hypothetical protein
MMTRLATKNRAYNTPVRAPTSRRRPLVRVSVAVVTEAIPPEESWWRRNGSPGPGAFTITERMLWDVRRRKAVCVLLVTYKSIR